MKKIARPFSKVLKKIYLSVFSVSKVVIWPITGKCYVGLYLLCGDDVAPSRLILWDSSLPRSL